MATQTLLTHLSLRVRDMDRSIKFYTDLLGLTAVVADHKNETLNSRVVLLRDSRTSQQLELNWYPDGGQFGVPFTTGESLDHVGVRVADVPAFVDAAERLGGKVADLRPFRDYPIHRFLEGNSMAFVEDPDGNILMVYDAIGYSLDEVFEGGY
jgi:catechol 2,3-dioxygenase-like lactoylglutathione lyase family enzyme